jgi:hypothetical protein
MRREPLQHLWVCNLIFLHDLSDSSVGIRCLYGTVVVRAVARTYRHSFARGEEISLLVGAERLRCPGADVGEWQ